MADLSGLLQDRRRLKNLAVLAFVVVLVNLPLLLSTWTNQRVESAGVDVTASVTAVHNLGTDAEPRWWVSFRFPEDIDPGQGTWAAHVDGATRTAAEESGTIGARVLADDPAAHTVSGEVRGRAGLWTTLAVDALLLLLLGLLWRFRVRPPAASAPAP